MIINRDGQDFGVFLSYYGCQLFLDLLRLGQIPYQLQLAVFFIMLRHSFMQLSQINTPLGYDQAKPHDACQNEHLNLFLSS